LIYIHHKSSLTLAVSLSSNLDFSGNLLFSSLQRSKKRYTNLLLTTLSTKNKRPGSNPPSNLIFSSDDLSLSDYHHLIPKHPEKKNYIISTLLKLHDSLDKNNKAAFNPDHTFVVNLWICDRLWFLPSSPSCVIEIFRYNSEPTIPSGSLLKPPLFFQAIKRSGRS